MDLRFERDLPIVVMHRKDRHPAIGMPTTFIVDH